METLVELLKKEDPRGFLYKKTLDNLSIVLGLLNEKTYKDRHGMAMGLLHEDYTKQVDKPLGQPALNGLCKKLEHMGLIEREIRGKRTFRIEAINVPVDVYDYLPERMKNSPVYGAEPEDVTIDVGPSVVYIENMDTEAPSEAEELGMRPGRLAARIEKSIPDIVTRAVDDAFENKLIQLFSGLGFHRGTDDNEELTALRDTAQRLVAVNEQLVEESRKAQAQLAHARQELNEAREKTAGGIIAGSLQPSQLKKELQDLARWALDNNWTIRRTNGGHLAWYYRQSQRAIFTASTPSDSHVVANIKGDLLRVMREYSG